MSTIFWLVEHWWIFAIVAALACVAAVWGGVVSLGVIVKALADIAAAIIKFFSNPPDQIAAKALYGLAACGFGIWIGYMHGTVSERAVWKQREAAHAAAMQKLETDTAAEAARRVNEAQAAERENTAAAERKADDYAKQLAAAPAGACGIDDADLAAAGVRAHGQHRLNKGRDSE